MRSRLLIAVLSMLAGTACGVHENPPVESAVTRPDKILDFNILYSENCAGCHGKGGKSGLALSLSDPVYLAIADDSVIQSVTSKGVAGTAMPAFAKGAGGSLTDQQIGVIVNGIRAWAKPDALRGQQLPPYAADVTGDAARGASVYETYCSSCHGIDGCGSARASSIVDPSYLALVSQQGLRTTVIVGRPELGAPDWRDDVAGKPMSSQDVSDVVAWLAAQRTHTNTKPIGETR